MALEALEVKWKFWRLPKKDGSVPKAMGFLMAPKKKMERFENLNQWKSMEININHPGWWMFYKKSHVTCLRSRSGVSFQVSKA